MTMKRAMKPNQNQRSNTQRRTQLPSWLTAVTLALAAQTAAAEVWVYDEVTGKNLATWTGNGKLTGTAGEFSGKNISDIEASRWMGAENGAFHIMNSSGFLEHYYAYGTLGTAYCCKGTSRTLTGGDLGGMNVQNANYLGATSEVMYYADNVGTAWYSELGNHTIGRNDTWTTFSGGGSLNGKTVQRGVGLLDMGGNTDISDDYLMNVAPDGTLEYYYMPTGKYTAGLELTYGSWKGFNGGKLDGLTLSTLATQPVGVLNGYSYRYLGNSNDQMYFDVTVAAVPELSSMASMAVGLAATAGLTASRRKRARKAV